MNMAVFLQQFYFYLVLLISIMSSLLMMNLAYAGRRPTGFSLELIHSDSLESKNLTQLERMERAFQQTKAAASMNSSWVSNNTVNTSPVQTYLFDHYVVKVGIGSMGAMGEALHPIFYYLSFDTGSDLLWIQCGGVVDPFHQACPYFPWDHSFSFSQVPCDDHVHCPTGECYGEESDPQFQYCKYNVLYGDGSNTTGYLAKETLTFDANNGQMGQIENFVFGCGMHQLNFGLTMGTKSVGIMGFGGGKNSIINQLGLTKFEYCLLPSWTRSTDSGPSTFLRFGSDTKISAGGQGVHTTPMYIARGTIYYVTMIGISVGGTPIQYVNGELGTKADGTGGCVFDTGTPYSRLSSAVLVPLQASLLQYFRRLTRHAPPPLYETCFELPISYHDFPAIIFHFDGGADFEIELNAAFISFTDFFCFNMFRGDSGLSVTVGGIQQGNHRILYDVGQQQLSWTHEDCAANP